MIRSLMAGLLLAGTAAAASETVLPPFTTGYEPTTVDERGLWMDADNRERVLLTSKLTMKDEALNAYVHGVLCRTVGQERCRGVRTYVVEMPAFNASMAPNGTMIVWTGLLMRARSEAELAAILGHEFAHFELRHSLNGFKQRRGATDLAAWVQVLGAVANTNTQDTQVSILASMFRFSREQEQAADLLGIKYMASAGYPATAAADVWQNIMAEDDASAIGRGRKPRQNYADGYFDTHPSSLRRATYLTAEAAKLGGTTSDPRTEALRAATATHWTSWLDAQIKINDFGGTEYLLDQLSRQSGWTGDLLFARGELYRQRGAPRDLVASAGFYRDAIAKGYTKPAVHRNLGMALLRTNHAADGTQALSEYLRLQPDANDAKAIQTLISTYRN